MYDKKDNLNIRKMFGGGSLECIQFERKIDK